MLNLKTVMGVFVTAGILFGAAPLKAEGGEDNIKIFFSRVHATTFSVAMKYSLGDLTKDVTYLPGGEEDVKTAMVQSLPAGSKLMGAQATIDGKTVDCDVTQRPPRYMGKPAHIKISIYNDKCSIIQLSKG